MKRKERGKCYKRKNGRKFSSSEWENKQTHLSILIANFNKHVFGTSSKYNIGSDFRSMELFKYQCQ